MIEKRFLALCALTGAMLVAVLIKTANFPGGFVGRLTAIPETVWLWRAVAFSVALLAWESRKQYKAQGWRRVLLGLLQFGVAWVFGLSAGLLAAGW